MTIRDIIKLLQEEGKQVSYYIRKDGGVRITKIDGESFSGSTGNQRAREIVGATLSEARAKQLAKIKTPKGKYDKRRKRKLEESTLKRIKKLQRLYRKNKTKGGGMPTIRNYRWVEEHLGKKEAERLLHQSELYIRGLAYSENIDFLKARIKADFKKVKGYGSEVAKLLERLESMKGVLKEETLSKILDSDGCLYHMEQGTIDYDEFFRQINYILDNN